jgi:hypothetical protein
LAEKALSERRSLSWVIRDYLEEVRRQYFPARGRLVEMQDGREVLGLGADGGHAGRTSREALLAAINANRVADGKPPVEPA